MISKLRTHSRSNYICYGRVVQKGKNHGCKVMNLSYRKQYPFHLCFTLKFKICILTKELENIVTYLNKLTTADEKALGLEE